MDPSMLIAFLIQTEDDWGKWKQSINEVQGKKIIHIADKNPSLYDTGVEREGAIDEVETFDDEDEEGLT
jgi:cysteine protease ATG4